MHLSPHKVAESPLNLDMFVYLDKQIVSLSLDLLVNNHDSEAPQSHQMNLDRWYYSERHGPEMDLDTSPIHYDWICFADYSLAFRHRLWLVPKRSACGQYLEASVPELRIVLTAATRRELVEDFEETLEFLWDDYVLDQNNLLSDTGLELRRELLARFKQIENVT